MMMFDCFLIFLWGFVRVSSTEETNTNTTSPCVIQMGDAPYTQCDNGEDLKINNVYNSEHDSLNWTTNTENFTTSSDINPTSHPITTSTAATVTGHSSAHPLEDTEPTQTLTLISTVNITQNMTSSISCTFDPCDDPQVTCIHTSDQHCRCSRVTSDLDDPESPLSVQVKAVTHSVARVQWCAFYSPLLEHVLVIRDGGLIQKTLRFGSSARQVFVSDLTAEHTYHICVHAVQREKTSAPKCTSVVMDINTELYMFILTVMCAVLILTVITLIFCLIKQCRKQPVENPHLTRLISIPNPAFINSIHNRADMSMCV